MTTEPKAAVVTGATSGLGWATAEALARRGVNVVAGGRDRARGEALVAQLAGAPGEVVFAPVELGDAGSVAAFTQTAFDRFGRLDAAVNNAASSAGVGVACADTSEEDFDTQLAVTLKGTWLCMREQLRAMTREGAGGGAIVNVSSINGLSGTRGGSAYAAAKHAVVGLTRSAALEYGPAGVRVNVVCPGPFSTPMLQDVIDIAGGGDQDGFVAAYQSQIPAGRFGEPAEAGETIAWLAVDAPRYLSGATLTIDGAMTA